MKNKKFICSIILYGLSFYPFINAAAEKDNQNSQLFVRGEARLMVSPDQVSVVLGVTTEDKDAKKAMAKNSKKMKGIVSVLKKLGLSEKEYKTQNFNVQPIWSPRPKSASRDWQATIASYRVNNQLHVSSKKIDQIGDIVSLSTAAGANNIHSIRFSLSNPRQYRSQAIVQAMANAKADAQVLADASGDMIKRTLSLQLDNAEASVVRAPRAAGMSLAKSMLESADVSPPPINGGDVTVRASVSVTYEIEKIK